LELSSNLREVRDVVDWLSEVGGARWKSGRWGEVFCLSKLVEGTVKSSKVVECSTKVVRGQGGGGGRFLLAKARGRYGEVFEGRGVLNEGRRRSGSAQRTSSKVREFSTKVIEGSGRLAAPALVEGEIFGLMETQREKIRALST